MNEPRYVCTRPLGNGGFGIVYEAKMIRDPNRSESDAAVSHQAPASGTTDIANSDGNISSNNNTGDDPSSSSGTSASAAAQSSSSSSGSPTITNPTSASSQTKNQQIELVAIKEIPPKKVDLESKRLVREVDILGMLSVHPCHSCVLRLLDAYVTMQQEGFSVNLVMPLYSGDLLQFSKELLRVFNHLHGNIPQSNRVGSGNPQFQQPIENPQQTLTYLSQVARVLAFKTIAGLSYIHSCSLVHRDMKPENIMIRMDRNDPANSEAVVGDFGLARAVSPTETFYTCTRQYRPPEVVTNTAKGNSSMDVWSLGCVLFELVTGTHLFVVPSARDRENRWVPALASQQLEAMLDVFGTPSIQDIPCVAGENVRTYLQKTRPRASTVRGRFERDFKLACSEQDREMWFSLVDACLQFVPDRRATAEQLLKHPLFTSQGFFVNSPTDPSPPSQEDLRHANLVVESPPPRVYRGGNTRDDIRTNKETILALVRKVHDHMFPHVAATGSSDDAATAALVFPNPTTERVGAWFGNVEAVLSDPEGALDGAEEAMRMTEDLTPAERLDLQKIANFCKLRLEAEKNVNQD